MLGRATASLERFPRSWLQRFWGVFDIDMRQKWRAAWPYLSILPRKHLRLLDAGCGQGSWSLELAARRPCWTVVGLDIDRESLDIAEAKRRELGLKNLSFHEADFLRFQPREQFDVILSVGSAHYLVERGSGAALFQDLSSWLKPLGLLVLLGPRRSQEVPTFRFLPLLRAYTVFGYEDLDSLSRTSGLEPQEIKPFVGRLGTLAKQIGKIGASGSIVVRKATYPIQLFLDVLDRENGESIARSSAAWLLIARKQDGK